MNYSVVLLDGTELKNLSAEQIRDLFLQRKLNQDSLFCSMENPRWQMLKRGFDLSKWIPHHAAPPAPAETLSLNNPFQQNFVAPPPVPVPQTHQNPVTFNQFPPVNNEPISHNTGNGYTQNNQSETYYQAESNQSNYNFQNSQNNFQPSRYNFQPAATAPLAAPPAETGRAGAKQAAIFIVINIFFYIGLTVAGKSLDDGAGTGKPTGGLGGLVIPIIIDLIFALNLWTQKDVDSARKWVLGRSYVGLLVFGIVFPVISLGQGDVFAALFSFIASLLYTASIGLTLHGKENPPTSRLMIGAGTFAIYFFLMMGSLGLVAIMRFVPETAALNLPDRQFEKYKIEGREFQDKTTGAKIALPDGWSMIALNNPLVRTPEARMIAVDKDGQSLTMLEVVPVPGNLDMKRQNPTSILDALSDNVVNSMEEDSVDSSFAEITRLGIYVGKHPAKLLVFEKTADGQKMKGHMIITYDELTFYVLHSWCPANAYDAKQSDFKHFEQSFVVPEKINSTFTQSAENEKKKTAEKKF